MRLWTEFPLPQEASVSNSMDYGILGKRVTVIVDRKMGSTHPKYKDMIYPVNYGYVPDAFAPDGEEQDAYILGVDRPVSHFEGVVIAVIHRLDDNEDKWVVASEGMHFSKDEIVRATAFTEKYFKTELYMWNT